MDSDIILYLVLAAV